MSFEAPSIKVVRRELPTNYITGCFPAPRFGSEDSYPMSLAVSILRDRLFKEVRTKRSLSYAPAAGLGQLFTNWGRIYVTFVDVKVNAVEVLKRQLRRAEPGSVFLSSACDGWQPIEAEWRLTRRCCELLLERGFRAPCADQEHAGAERFGHLHRTPGQVGITLTTLDERLRELWEPGTASVRGAVWP